jgi:hypothetical protein
VSSRFVWRSLANNITSWEKSCLHSKRSKIHHHTRLLPQPIPIPQRRFAHLHIDLVHPSQYSIGQKKSAMERKIPLLSLNV